MHVVTTFKALPPIPRVFPVQWGAPIVKTYMRVRGLQNPLLHPTAGGSRCMVLEWCTKGMTAAPWLVAKDIVGLEGYIMYLVHGSQCPPCSGKPKWTGNSRCSHVRARSGGKSTRRGWRPPSPEQCTNGSQRTLSLFREVGANLSMFRIATRPKQKLENGCSSWRTWT